MKHKYLLSFCLLTVFSLFISSCTSTKKLSYLRNLPETKEEQYFTMEIPQYKIQPRDVLYITIKAMTPDGTIADLLYVARGSNVGVTLQGESGTYLIGYDVNPEGNIILPAIGPVNVAGLTLEEIRHVLQIKSDSIFKNSTVECKLMSFKFTVIGEVKVPGTYINYNNYLTVLEAIGRAGGVGDYGRRDKILVVRPIKKGTKTYLLNLQDKNLLSSDAYFLLPNDVVIVEPQGNKIFSMNLPAISFILTAFTSVLTTTLLLINYFGK